MNKKLEQAIEDGWMIPEPIDLGGVKYWTFKEKGFKQTQSRLEAFSDTLSVHDTFNTTQSDYEAMHTAVRSSLNLATLDLKEPKFALEHIQQAVAILDNFKARVEMSNPLEKSLELASFLYVQEDENPFTYDRDLNKEKIKDWKKKAEVILSTILERQIPNFLMSYEYFQISFLNSIRGNLNEAMQLYMKQLMASTLRGQEKETLGTLTSRVETISSLNAYYTELLNHTIDSLPKSLPELEGKAKPKTEKNMTDG